MPARLKPYARNLKTYDPDHVAKAFVSIGQFSRTVPVRVRAARELVEGCDGW